MTADSAANHQLAALIQAPWLVTSENATFDRLTIPPASEDPEALREREDMVVSMFIRRARRTEALLRGAMEKLQKHQTVAQPDLDRFEEVIRNLRLEEIERDARKEVRQILHHDQTVLDPLLELACANAKDASIIPKVPGGMTEREVWLARCRDLKVEQMVNTQRRWAALRRWNIILRSPSLGACSRIEDPIREANWIEVELKKLGIWETVDLCAGAEPYPLTFFTYGHD